MHLSQNPADRGGAGEPRLPAYPPEVAVPLIVNHLQHRHIGEVPLARVFTILFEGRDSLALSAGLTGAVPLGIDLREITAAFHSAEAPAKGGSLLDQLRSLARGDRALGANIERSLGELYMLGLIHGAVASDLPAGPLGGYPCLSGAIVIEYGLTPLGARVRDVLGDASGSGAASSR